MVLLIKVKDRYFNYENINQFDFEIRQSTEDDGPRYHWWLNIGSGDKTIATINLETKEKWERAKQKLESAIIWGSRFVDLLDDNETNEE